jgi:hypothetical protein
MFTPGPRREPLPQEFHGRATGSSGEELEVLWRLQTERGVVWECVWYRTDAGFELRVRREGDERDVIALRRFVTLTEDIAHYAAGWKRTGLAKGWTPL